MTATGLVSDPIFTRHDPGPGHPESPARLQAIARELSTTGLLERLTPVVARAATPEEVCLVHDEDYYQRVAATAGSRVMLDPDTVTSEDSFQAARQAVGGCLELVRAVVAGELNNGYALVRPPGHHAERDRAMGFCLFNNVAVAAEYALHELGLRRVAIVDWDLHHGNGTMHSFHERDDVLYLSTHQFPYYPGTGRLEDVGRGAGAGYTVNVPLDVGMDDGDFCAIFDQLLVPIVEAYHPELLLVSTGYDIYERDPLGGMRVSAAGFGALAGRLRRVAERVCQGRLVLVLEGGYNLQGLAQGVVAATRVLLDEAGEEAAAEPSGPAAAIIERCRQVQRAYWPL